MGPRLLCDLIGLRPGAVLLVTGAMHDESATQQQGQRGLLAVLDQGVWGEGWQRAVDRESGEDGAPAAVCVLYVRHPEGAAARAARHAQWRASGDQADVVVVRAARATPQLLDSTDGWLELGEGRWRLRRRVGAPLRPQLVASVSAASQEFARRARATK
jgi:hypothetical protein